MVLRGCEAASREMRNAPRSARQRRRRCTGSNPTIDSDPPPGAVLKPPPTHFAAVVWTWFMALRIPLTQAFLKNHRRKPYVITGTMHDLYNRCFCMGVS